MVISKKIGLKREIGLFESSVYGIGIILGAGIYALIGKAAGEAGNALWLSFLIAAVIASLTGLSYAELSSRFPKAAAEMVYARKAFKNNIIAFLIGYLTIVTGIIAVATVALGFAGYFTAIFNMPIILVAMVLIIVLSFINFFGIKESSYMNIVLTIVETLGLLIIIFLGINYFGSVNYFEIPSFSGIFVAAILIFFAYLGFEDIVNIAEETKKPRKILPKAIIISVIVTTIIYVLVAMSVVSIVPWDVLGESPSPLSDVSEKAMPGSSFTFSIIALFATANTVLILLIVGSRMLYGMAKQGMFHKSLAKVHRKRRTPYLSVLLFMIISMVFVLFGDIKIVAEITNFGAFLIFLSVNISLIYVRYRYKTDSKKIFKVPLNIGRFPLIPFFGALFCFGMFFYFDFLIILFNIFIILIGVVLFFIIKPKRI